MSLCMPSAERPLVWTARTQVIDLAHAGWLVNP